MFYCVIQIINNHLNEAVNYSSHYKKILIQYSIFSNVSPYFKKTGKIAYCIRFEQCSFYLWYRRRFKMPGLPADGRAELFSLFSVFGSSFSFSTVTSCFKRLISFEDSSWMCCSFCTKKSYPLQWNTLHSLYNAEACNERAESFLLLFGPFSTV